MSQNPIIDRWVILPVSAVGNAESAGIRVAYSNEAFELWYCLHFAYITSG
ncbi:MAG: RloB domain-containing protein, partial [Chloroflexota bacterium]